MPDPGSAPSELTEIVARALEEDLGTGDVTTSALIDGAARARAEIRLREAGLVVGLVCAEAAFRALDPDASFEALVPEGAAVEAGAVIARVEGRARAILSAERTALNFVARLSGVATLTSRFVAAVAGTRARIYDTRKTTPGLRSLEKYAVRAGGGSNHRMGLHDRALVKDNHLILFEGGAAEAVRRARSRAGFAVEVEATTLDDALASARAGADAVMLDNLAPDEAARIVRAIRAEFPSPPPEIEISGGVTLENVREFAESGADRISVGALTHSARALDVTLAISPA
jgi:nicotinate-nucleotide pyrophosphorylase (carboxylating)